MTERFQFGLVVRGQAEPDEDIARRFAATLRFVREADRLGVDSLTKTAHCSAHPFQMLQLVPMLARFTAEALRLRLNAGSCCCRCCRRCMSPRNPRRSM
jgi:hypothetical protein